MKIIKAISLIFLISGCTTDHYKSTKYASSYTGKRTLTCNGNEGLDMCLARHGIDPRRTTMQISPHMAGLIAQQTNPGRQSLIEQQRLLDEQQLNNITNKPEFNLLVKQMINQNNGNRNLAYIQAIGVFGGEGILARRQLTSR